MLCYRTCLVWTRFTETRTRRSTGQHPRRARYVPRINLTSSTGQPLINRRFISPSIYRLSRLFLFLKIRWEQLCTMPEKATGTIIFWANWSVGDPSWPVPPCSATSPCAVSTRLARGMFGFGVDRLDSACTLIESLLNIYSIIIVFRNTDKYSVRCNESNNDFDLRNDLQDKRSNSRLWSQHCDSWNIVEFPRLWPSEPKIVEPPSSLFDPNNRF